MLNVKKIVIITTGQPSTNPRAVKEAITLSEEGYKVFFIYKFWTGWAIPFDEKIIKENPGISWQMAGANPFNNKTVYYFSRLRHKYFRWINKISPNNIFFAINASIRGFSSLAKMAIGITADIYIAHNLGALPIAAIAAKMNNSKYAFDAEDYHRGQEADNSIEQTRAILIEDKFLPGTSYITAASPLIAEKYSEHYNREVTVINNVFSKKYLAKEIKEPSKPIKLFWFSQTIGQGRGLEDIILALREMPADEFSLTLLGKHDEAIRNYFMELGKKGDKKIDIIFLQPVSMDEIFQIAAKHDIGLALEQPGELNRNLCLTNKIFTYMLAGNAIVFSVTKAQDFFLKANKNVGSIYTSGNIKMLIDILTEYINNITILSTQRKNARQLAAQKYNWENESGIFLKTLNPE